MLRAIFNKNQSALPPSVLQENHLGRWRQGQPFSFEFGKLELSAHASFPAIKNEIPNGRYQVYISGILFDDNAISEFPTSNSNQTLENFDELLSNWLRPLSGEYGGIAIDVEEQVLYLFANACATVPVFYSTDGETVICSTHLIEQARLRTANLLPNTIHPDSAICYLSQGGMLDQHTLLNNVSRVLPGEMVKLDLKTGSSRTTYYHQFVFPDFVEDESNAIEMLESSLSDAVDAHYQFDQRHGKKFLGSLSGGLDSRMDSVIAFERGFTERTNFTFGENGCADIHIAETIAAKLQQPQITVGLAGGDFIRHYLETACIANGGVSLAVGATHAVFAVSQIALDDFGILHTGNLGDAILGSYLIAPDRQPPNVKIGSYSRVFARQLQDMKSAVATKFESHEMFAMQTRGFLTINGGMVQQLPWIIPTSPFLDTQFIQAAMAIHPRLRWGNYIYGQWIKKLHPLADQFPWEKTMARPSAKLIKGKSKRQFLAAVMRRIDPRPSHRKKKINAMNPFDQWEQINSRLATFIKDEIESHSDFGVQALGNLWAEVIQNPMNLTAIEKLQIISFLYTAKWLGQV